MYSSWCDSSRATPFWNKYLTQPGFVWRHYLLCSWWTGSCSMSEDCLFICLGNLDQNRVGFFVPSFFRLNMANWLDGNPAENNESQPCGGFHSQAVHSWPDKGILYTAAPTRSTVYGSLAGALCLCSQAWKRPEAKWTSFSRTGITKLGGLQTENSYNTLYNLNTVEAFTDILQFSCNMETTMDNEGLSIMSPPQKAHCKEIMYNLSMVFQGPDLHYSCLSFADRQDHYATLIKAHYSLNDVQ